MKEPPKYSACNEVDELYPLICQFGRIQTKVSEDESRRDNWTEEPNIERINSGVDKGFVFLEIGIGKSPANYSEYAEDVGLQIVEVKIILDVLILVHKIGITSENKGQTD